MADRLAALAPELAAVAIRNIGTEFPYATQHVALGPDEPSRPRQLHPAFAGAYDWHSCVHMHWLLLRLRTDYPQWIDVGTVEDTLNATLRPAAIEVEADYLRAHPEFERPYGWAWAYALAAAAARCPAGARWSTALAPLADTVSSLAVEWLRRTPAPVRYGVHSNTAFALSLLLDAATVLADTTLADAVRDRAIAWYHNDRDYPIGWEPSGQDFLSPALTEADLLRRVLPAAEFPVWLSQFLPTLNLRTLTPLDPGDGQQSHLYGLGLSRAWQLRALATALPADDPRGELFRTAAEQETAANLAAVTGSGFHAEHWLASFAFLALTDDPRTVVPGTVEASREGTG